MGGREGADGGGRCPIRLIRIRRQARSEVQTVYDRRFYAFRNPVLSRPPGRATLPAFCLAALYALSPQIAVADQHPGSAGAVDDIDAEEPRKPRALAVKTVKVEKSIVPYDRHSDTGHVLLERRDDGVSVHIDGRLDEEAWRDLEVHDDFRLIDPDTLAPARCRPGCGCSTRRAASTSALT